MLITKILRTPSVLRAIAAHFWKRSTSCVITSKLAKLCCINAHFKPLENFDAIASWRTHDEGNLVDPTATVFDGTKINGPTGLRNWLATYSNQFVQVVAEKLLTYALGRGVEYQDMPLVRSLARDAAKDGNKFSALVLGVVKSKPFQMNIKMQETRIQANKEKGN